MNTINITCKINNCPSEPGNYLTIDEKTGAILQVKIKKMQNIFFILWDGKAYILDSENENKALWSDRIVIDCQYISENKQ